MAGTATAEPKTARRAQKRIKRRRGFLAFFAVVRPVEAEALLVLTLFGFAMAMRWPNLMRLPHFTDEIGEIRWTLAIWRGEHFPLTAQVKYFGPVHHYFVALCFWLLGPSLTLPRTIVCVIGALTVVLTYLIGREVADWRVGALGAALLATLPQHIVVNSHVAWANSTTPFYAALCCWAVLRAARAARAEGRGQRAEGRTGDDESHVPTQAARPSTFRPLPSALWLLLCGFSFGLMLQTHVGTVVLAPALAGTFGVALWRWRARRVLRSPWTYLSVVTAAAAYSPVIIDNLQNGLAGFYRAKGRNYAYTADPNADTYLHNLRNLLFELARMISNPFRMPERVLDYFTSPYMAIMVGLAILGLLLLARRGQPLPLLALISTALLMPYFNHAYGVEGDRYLLTGRYVAYLLPLLTVGVAAGALMIVERGTRNAERGIWPGVRRGTSASSVPNSAFRVPRSAFMTVAVVLLLTLVLYPIVPLRRYYTLEAQLDPDNASFLETVRLVSQVRGPRTPVLIGPLFGKVDLKDGAEALDILDILLTLDGVPHRVLQDPRTEIPKLAAGIDPNDNEALPIVIMMRDECFPIREEVPLQRISGRFRLRELYWNSPSYYGVYRYAPGGQPAGCLPAAGPTPGD